MTPGPSHRRPAARDANGWCSPHPKSGNVRQLAGVTGTVTASYAYDSFGGLRQSADNDTTYKNEFQYKDEIADAGTGTIYLRARYYDPTATGRFISRDPVAGYTASPQSLNGYAYAMSNPVMRSDPTGLLPEGVSWLPEMSPVAPTILNLPWKRSLRSSTKSGAYVALGA